MKFPQRANPKDCELNFKEKPYCEFHTGLLDETYGFCKKCKREYVLETGKMYLVNTSVEHAVVNFGERDWVILHFTPDDYQIDDLLGLTGKL